MAISSIKNIFKINSEIPINSNELIIRETDNDGSSNTLKKIKINKISSDEILCYKLDQHIPLTKYFDATNKIGFNKGLDAVLFYKKDDTGYILFFELKSYTLKQKDVANKYFASTAFIHQISFILKNIYDVDILDYKASAIVFSLNKNNERLEKFGMRPDMPIYKNTNYTNTKKTLQVLEITKNNGQNFTVSIDKILDETRFTKFKNWP